MDLIIVPVSKALTIPGTVSHSGPAARYARVSEVRPMDWKPSKDLVRTNRKVYDHEPSSTPHVADPVDPGPPPKTIKSTATDSKSAPRRRGKVPRVTDQPSRRRMRLNEAGRAARENAPYALAGVGAAAGIGGLNTLYHHAQGVDQGKKDAAAERRRARAAARKAERKNASVAKSEQDEKKRTRTYQAGAVTGSTLVGGYAANAGVKVRRHGNDLQSKIPKGYEARDHNVKATGQRYDRWQQLKRASEADRLNLSRLLQTARAETETKRAAQATKDVNDRIGQVRAAARKSKKVGTGLIAAGAAMPATGLVGARQYERARVQTKNSKIPSGSRAGRRVEA